MTPRVAARGSRPACSVTFPRGVGRAGWVAAARERPRDRSVRSLPRVSIADVCGARTTEVLSARSELSLSSAPSSSGLECPPRGAAESRLSEEDVDEDSEELFPSNPELPPWGCCAVCEN